MNDIYKQFGLNKVYGETMWRLSDAQGKKAGWYGLQWFSKTLFVRWGE